MRAPVDIERVRGGKLRYAKPDSILPVELQVGGVIFRAQFGVAHIFQANQSAIGIRLENDVVELARLAESAHGPHADLILLPLRRRLLANLSGCDFHVLLRQSASPHRRRQPASRHAHRIQPQPHGVLALAEDNHVGDARNSLQRIPARKCRGNCS